MAQTSVTIFATWWCGDCSRVRRFFEKNNIPYKWVDIDNDKDAEEFVISTNHGIRSVPTIIFEDGSILVEPTDGDLMQKLGFILRDI